MRSVAWRAPVLATVLACLCHATGATPMVVQSTTSSTAPSWAGDAIERPLSPLLADAERGRAIVASRQTGLCLLCHSLEASAPATQGNLAPPLAGTGARLSAGQLRARLVDSRRIDPASIMPAYFVVTPAGADAVDPVAQPSRHVRVAMAWQGRSLLDAQQIEDVIAYLLTLREPS